MVAGANRETGARLWGVEFCPPLSTPLYGGHPARFFLIAEKGIVFIKYPLWCENVFSHAKV